MTARLSGCNSIPLGLLAIAGVEPLQDLRQPSVCLAYMAKGSTGPTRSLQLSAVHNKCLKPASYKADHADDGPLA